MTVFAEVGQNSCFLALFLEPLQRALKVLVIVDYDF